MAAPLAPEVMAACLMLASQTYEVPTGALLGIMHVEGGRIGTEAKNTNGTADLGPMQVNTIWLPKLADHWNVDQATARKWVRDDGCVNVMVAAWIFRQKISQTGQLLSGIQYYHSATPRHGVPYAAKVVAAMNKMGVGSKNLPSDAEMRLKATLAKAGQLDSAGPKKSKKSSQVRVYRGSDGRLIATKGEGAAQPTRLHIIAKSDSKRPAARQIPVYRSQAVVVRLDQQGMARDAVATPPASQSQTASAE